MKSDHLPGLACCLGVAAAFAVGSAIAADRTEVPNDEAVEIVASVMPPNPDPSGIAVSEITLCQTGLTWAAGSLDSDYGNWDKKQPVYQLLVSIDSVGEARSSRSSFRQKSCLTMATTSLNASFQSVCEG